MWNVKEKCVCVSVVGEKDGEVGMVSITAHALKTTIESLLLYSACMPFPKGSGRWFVGLSAFDLLLVMVEWPTQKAN
jgi:hypothetical protein